jgi:putative Mg2+ transporter-C (MgtC) family protein
MSPWWLALLDSLRAEFGWGAPEPGVLARALLRLSLAVLAGGLMGWDRQRRGKSAGLRTHMLVCVGGALFILATIETIGVQGRLADVYQGLAQGIGFIGGGVILQLTRQRRVMNLTTAATLWATAAVGGALGAGHYTLAAVAVAVAMFVLKVCRLLEPQKKSNLIERP